MSNHGSGITLVIYILDFLARLLRKWQTIFQRALENINDLDAGQSGFNFGMKFGNALVAVR